MGTSVVLPELYNLPDILPNSPLFVRLLGFAHRLPSSHVAIRDIHTSASHLQLLTDVLALRNTIYQTLDEETSSKLKNEEEDFFLLLACPGYEYAVSFLSILALGGAVVPISPHVPLQEALYFAEKSTSRTIVFTPPFRDLGASIQEHICGRGHQPFTAVDAILSLSRKNLKANEIYISATRSLDPNKAGLVIFTLGTTGPPKAVILPREILSSGAQALTDHYEITPQDTALHCMPVHHVAGITVCFVPFLIAGACIEFDAFNVERIWERWRMGGITVFGGVVISLNR